VELARQKQLEPLIGRQAELRALTEVLACRNRNKPILLGEPGVGKVAVVAGLAHSIADRTSPEWLRSWRIVELQLSHLWDMIRLNAGKSERANALFAEIRRTSDMVLFLPDFIATLGATGGGSAMRYVHTEILLTLREDRVPCILVASTTEYRRYVSRRGSIDQFVQPVQVRPASMEETLVVLQGIRSRYETYHRVQVPDEVLKLIAESAERLPGALPGKAVQLLDRCAARTRLRELEPSPDEAAALRAIDEQLEQLNQQKEEAVAEQNFQQAAEFRDRCDKLKQSKVEQMRDKLRTAIVDVATVEEVVRDLTAGQSPETASA
jgi:ATP-dependent Clp protease ATP-binding subunit ClpC